MNKIIAIFLITVFLCANTTIGQLWKVPNLIEHYKEHKGEVLNQSVSFIDFIKDHYSKNAENNKKEHQNLPFKTFDTTSHVLFTFSNVSFQLDSIKVIILEKKKFFYTTSFKSYLFTSIWLPPKIA